MAANDNDRLQPPRCYKCGGATRLYNRVRDPQSRNTFDLFECPACDLVTSHLVSRQ
jgi:hypothetical protein